MTLYLKGATRLLTDKLRYADRKRYRATILLLTGEIASTDEVPEGVALVAGDYFSTVRRKVLGILKIARLAWSHDVIVGYSELTPTYMTVVASLLSLKRPFGVVHVHLSTMLGLGLRPGVHRYMVSFFYPLLRNVIGCSDGVSEDLRQSFRLKNVLSVPNSVDVDRITSMASQQLPAPMTPLFDRPVILNVGVLGFQKAHDVLLKAFARVKEAGFPHDLVIVGEGPDRSKLETLAGELGVAGRVHFIGYQTNPYPLFRRAELFVLSSRFEGLPLVLAEALVLGLPIVSTDYCNGGAREVLADGACGILVPVDDPEALAQGITKILSDPELADRLRNASIREGLRRDSRKFSELFLRMLTSGSQPQKFLHKNEERAA